MSPGHDQRDARRLNRVCELEQQLHSVVACLVQIKSTMSLVGVGPFCPFAPAVVSRHHACRGKFSCCCDIPATHYPLVRLETSILPFAKAAHIMTLVTLLRLTMTRLSSTNVLRTKIVMIESSLPTGSDVYGSSLND